MIIIKLNGRPGWSVMLVKKIATVDYSFNIKLLYLHDTSNLSCRSLVKINQKLPLLLAMMLVGLAVSLSNFMNVFLPRITTGIMALLSHGVSSLQFADPSCHIMLIVSHAA